jgi:hypothetical protein
LKLRRIIIIVIAALLLAAIGWFAYRIFFVLDHIPEAYAAWDTGTLLVEYMKVHDNRWQTSWNDLLTVLDSDHGREILLRGSRADETVVQYARTLQNQVSIDWTFDPRKPGNNHPVTRNDGSPFPMVWQGAEPNEMIREYLAEKPATKPST